MNSSHWSRVKEEKLLSQGYYKESEKTMDYKTFIDSKSRISERYGFEISAEDLHPNLFDFQRDIVRWALAKGRAAIFADCGLGKTLMQLSWAYEVTRHTGKPVLILAPLAVSAQTVAEGQRFGIPVHLCEKAEDVTPGINITNYEKLDRFDTSVFAGVVLDESSILKSFTGKVRNQLIESFSRTPYRLACTATPAPNDFMELGNHSEFLGVMSRTEMLSMYFVHDSGETSKWRLKGHAETSFWQWMASWAVVLDNPASLGYEDEGYTLPEIRMHEIVVDGDAPVTEKLTLTQRRSARKESLQARCRAAAELVNASTEQWLVWCDLNAESEELHRVCSLSQEVKGADKATHKVNAMTGFSVGLPDYVLTFRLPGGNPEPVSHENGLSRFYGDDEPEGIKGARPEPDADLMAKKEKYNTEPVYSHQVWRRYASPVWMDIRQSNTLNRAAARDKKDERHICPLQLDLIARCLELWTNPNDIVLDPFAGIGSVPVVALRMGRRTMGFELKESYFKQAVLNCQKEENHDNSNI